MAQVRVEHVYVVNKLTVVEVALGVCLGVGAAGVALLVLSAMFIGV